MHTQMELHSFTAVPSWVLMGRKDIYRDRPACKLFTAAVFVFLNKHLEQHTACYKYQ